MGYVIWIGRRAPAARQARGPIATARQDRGPSAAAMIKDCKMQIPVIKE